jgi:hypothetical protein
MREHTQVVSYRRARQSSLRQVLDVGPANAPEVGGRLQRKCAGGSVPFFHQSCAASTALCITGNTSRLPSCREILKRNPTQYSSSKMPSKGNAQIPYVTRQIASALHPTRHYRHVGIKIAQRYDLYRVYNEGIQRLATLVRGATVCGYSPSRRL